MSKNKRAQGEIFGIALMFVIIIVGIIVYAQVKALSPNRDVDLQSEGEYKILAEGSLNTILEISTSCYVEQGRDTMQDLINYCLEFSFSKTDPTFQCESPINTIRACSHVIENLNQSLNTIFSKDNIGEIPYELNIEVPANQNSILNNVSLTNFGRIKVKNITLTQDNYRKLGFKRAPSGLKTWATAQRNINFELYLYYK